MTKENLIEAFRTYWQETGIPFEGTLYLGAEDFDILRRNDEILYYGAKEGYTFHGYNIEVKTPRELAEMIMAFSPCEGTSEDYKKLKESVRFRNILYRDISW